MNVNFPYRLLLPALCSLLAGCFQAQLSGPVTNASISVATLEDPETVLMEARGWDENFLLDLLGTEDWQALSPIGQLILQGIYLFEPALLSADNHWLLVTAIGGRDIDRDGDLIPGRAFRCHGCQLVWPGKNGAPRYTGCIKQCPG